MNGIDYSFARPGGSAIKAAGYGFACRYLSSSTGKALTASELADLHNNGLTVVVVFEDTANQSLNGHAQGIADAQEALNQANALGIPNDRPIYFAVDFDATAAQQAAIDAYLQGAATIIGANRVGVYGGFNVVSRCAANGTAKWFWQTLAWSGGQQFSGNHIYQNGQSAFGGGADVDVSMQNDFGQYGDIIKLMNSQQAAELALYIRLLAFESVDQANSHSADDVAHMLADPAYAGAIAKAVYSGEWQQPAYKAGHYDEVVAEVATLQKQLANKPAPTPAPNPTPTPAPVKKHWWEFWK